MARALAAGSRADGVTQTDLENTTLAAVLDDARSLSLFASDRVIWISSAELALPRRLSTGSDETDEDSKAVESGLAGYLKAPTPGTVMVFECSRFDFAGDDRAKLERVEKYYAPIGQAATVEFRHLSQKPAATWRKISPGNSG